MAESDALTAAEWAEVGELVRAARAEAAGQLATGQAYEYWLARVSRLATLAAKVHAAGIAASIEAMTR